MKLEIWFEFASTYSYLTVCRADGLLRESGVAVEWKPFLLGPIFRQRGLETSPFVQDDIKGRYMWRDVARRAQRLGLPFVRPAVFPAQSLLAARVMTAALGEPWCGAFAKRVFEAQFGEGQDIAEGAVLADALTACDADPEHWLAVAHSEDVKADLRGRTEGAQALGIFGAPSFRVGDELFWGDDRFEDAIEWAVSSASDGPLGGG